MKKIILLVVSLCVLFALTACGQPEITGYHIDENGKLIATIEGNFAKKKKELEEKGYLLKHKEKKNVWDCKGASKAGLCSEERSMISPDYARNFICDFILGIEQINTQLSLFQ